MRAVLVTKGGTQMGMGHIYRTITLAKGIMASLEVSFITTCADEMVIKLIRESGFTMQNLQNDTELVRYLSHLNPEIVIFDQLNIEERLAYQIKTSTKSQLVLFENMSTANNYASIVVNAVMDSYFKNYQYYMKDTSYYCGPKYWILRDEFYEYKKKKKPLSPDIEKITLVFGASDPANLSTKVLNELLKLDQPFQLNLCLGIHFMYSDDLHKMLDQYPTKQSYLNVHADAKNLADLMYSSDLVITSPGTCAFEALVVGTPIIAISQNPIHDEAFRGYLDTINEARLSEIPDIIKRSGYISPYQKEIIAAEIGEGKKEVLKAIINLV